TAPLPREPEPARPPSPALAATAILPAAAAREVEPQRPASVLLPLGGQDVSFHVQVKLDVSPVVEALAARAAQQPAQGGLLPALLLALLCLVAAGATGAAVARGGGARAGLLVGAPLGAALLAVAAFGLGLMSGRCRAAGDNKGGRG
ncbi:MAG: hypothetical protein IT372_06535, partial [Polyangiaceae bacterium]|nr:hypothetical protein [Polyangiaceae bacterium]